MSFVELSLYVPMALSASEEPAVTEVVAGLTAIDIRVAGLDVDCAVTVILVEPVTAPSVA